MLLKLLLTDLPEAFYTINLLPGILMPTKKFGLLTLALIIGAFFIIACLAVFFIFYFRKNLGSKKYYSILLGLIAAVWLPLYLNFSYNNVYDLTENLSWLKYSVSAKRILRTCQMDNRQNLGNIYCRLFSFFTFTKNSLPVGTNVQLLTSPGLDGYFDYFLYPNYKIVNSADYILFYYPNDYIYKDNILYHRQGDKDFVVGKYKILFAKSAAELILKKQ
jgi:hypothetical protein